MSSAIPWRGCALELLLSLDIHEHTHMQALRSLAAHNYNHSLARHNPLLFARCDRPRQFTSSSPRHGHYETLGIPKDATKNQIKVRGSVFDASTAF